MNTDERWVGWLAGMIDGEGTVAIARSLNRKGYQRGIQMRAFVQIAGTERAAIDRAKELLEQVSGHRAFIHAVTRYNPNHKPGWAVGTYSNSAMLALLTILRPLFIIKKEHAVGVGAFWRRHLIPGRRRTDEDFHFDEIDYARCRVLNARGNHGGPDLADLEAMLHESEPHDG